MRRGSAGTSVSARCDCARLTSLTLKLCKRFRPSSTRTSGIKAGNASREESELGQGQPVRRRARVTHGSLCESGRRLNESLSSQDRQAVAVESSERADQSHVDLIASFVCETWGCFARCYVFTDEVGTKLACPALRHFRRLLALARPRTLSLPLLFCWLVNNVACTQDRTQQGQPATAARDARLVPAHSLPIADLPPLGLVVFSLTQTAFFVCDIVSSPRRASLVGRSQLTLSCPSLAPQQERFRLVIHAYPAVIATAEKMLKAAKLMDVPVIATEQNPKGASAPSYTPHFSSLISL